MMLRTIGVLTAVLVLIAVVPMRSAHAEDVNVTGAWDVTITTPSGSAAGLAILSQDGGEIVGMIGPAVTDMMPVVATMDGNTLTLQTRPRKGRTAAFAKCELTVTPDRMTGAIDTDKGTIEFVRKKR